MIFIILKICLKGGGKMKDITEDNKIVSVRNGLKIGCSACVARCRCTGSAAWVTRYATNVINQSSSRWMHAVYPY